MTRTEITDEHREDVAAFMKKHWHSTLVMSRGRKFYPHKEQGLVEHRDGELVGLLTYHIDGEEMEILTLNSTLERQRIGTSLMLAVIEKARQAKCSGIRLTTTNANLRAVGFYQRLGFRMVAINVNAVEEARKIKPEIPESGEGGIALRDEVVMELRIKPYIDA